MKKVLSFYFIMKKGFCQFIVVMIKKKVYLHPLEECILSPLQG